MKSLLLLASTLLLLAAASPSRAQTLTLLGTNSFAIDSGSVIGLTYSQTSNFTTVSISFGGSLGGLFIEGPFNWSSIPTTDFGLLMSVPAADPQQNFSIEFYNSRVLDPVPENFAIAQFQGVTTGVSNVLTALAMVKNNSYVPLGGSGGLNDFSDVAAMQFTWNNPVEPGTSTQANLGGIVVVPEPSTWALLVTASVFSAFLVWRRRSLARR